MGIKYFEEERVFKLDTPTSTYMIGIVDQENFVGHIYYGKTVQDHDLRYLMRIDEPPFIPSHNNRDRVSFLDCFPMEYSTHGLGDYREDCLQVLTNKGYSACNISYVSHKTYQGKPGLTGLPATFGTDEECTTLELNCLDHILDLQIRLIYTVFKDVDAITRNVQIKNCST